MAIAALKKVGCLALVMALSIASYYFFLFVYTAIERLHAYTSQTYMVELSGFLRDYQPRIVDPVSFRAFLRQHRKQIYFRDGWGRPLVVETWRDKEAGLYHYRITSLGRSGKRSSCCKGAVGHNWDLNSVIEDDKFIQVWDS
jgi:hypothetical protein